MSSHPATQQGTPRKIYRATEALLLAASLLATSLAAQTGARTDGATASDSVRILVFEAPGTTFLKAVKQKNGLTTLESLKSGMVRKGTQVTYVVQTDTEHYDAVAAINSSGAPLWGKVIASSDLLFKAYAQRKLSDLEKNMDMNSLMRLTGGDMERIDALITETGDGLTREVGEQKAQEMMDIAALRGCKTDQSTRLLLTGKPSAMERAYAEVIIGDFPEEAYREANRLIKILERLEGKEAAETAEAAAGVTACMGALDGHMDKYLAGLTASQIWPRAQETGKAVARLKGTEYTDNASSSMRPDAGRTEARKAGTIQLPR